MKTLVLKHELLLVLKQPDGWREVKETYSIPSLGLWTGGTIFEISALLFVTQVTNLRWSTPL